jgi:hypothetical protein
MSSEGGKNSFTPAPPNDHIGRFPSLLALDSEHGHTSEVLDLKLALNGRSNNQRHCLLPNERGRMCTEKCRRYPTLRRGEGLSNRYEGKLMMPNTPASHHHPEGLTRCSPHPGPRGIPLVCASHLYPRATEMMHQDKSLRLQTATVATQFIKNRRLEDKGVHCYSLLIRLWV